jgi:uncharacterized membrane protein
MTMKRALAVSLVFVGAMWAAAGLLYGRLPDPVPSHWGPGGRVDGWMPKPWGAFLLPATALGVVLLLAALPTLSPRGYRIERFGATYARLLVLFAGFFAALEALVLAACLGHDAMTRAPLLLVGALLVGIGNYLGKTTPNFFVGVRTPWTLASPEVWTRTHRLAGWLFVATGALLVLLGLLAAPPLWTLALVALPALVPVAYSYLLYRRLEGFDRSDDDRPPAPPPAP